MYKEKVLYTLRLLITKNNFLVDYLGKENIRNIYSVTCVVLPKYLDLLPLTLDKDIRKKINDYDAIIIFPDYEEVDIDSELAEQIILHEVGHILSGYNPEYDDNEYVLDRILKDECLADRFLTKPELIIELLEKDKQYLSVPEDIKYLQKRIDILKSRLG